MLAIARKEVRQLARDRLTVGMIVGIPLIQILLFGYAINLDVRHLRPASLDQAQTLASRALVGDMQATQVGRLRRASAASDAELREVMRAARASVGIVHPAGLRAPPRSTATAPVAQLLVDGSRPGARERRCRLAAMPLPCAAPAHASRRAPPVRGARRVQPRAPHGRADRARALIGVILTHDDGDLHGGRDRARARARQSRAADHDAGRARAS